MSNARSLASQLCGIFPYLCLQFSLGTVNGYTIIIIAELYKEDSEIPATLDQLSWYASLIILKLLSSIMTGGLVHRFGSRLIAVSAALLFLISYLLYYYSTNMTTILVSGAISSIPVINSLAFPHASEISEPRYRSSFLAMNHLVNAFGMFFSQLLGSLMYWRTVALVNLLFPIAVAITVLVTPNSPTWLASKGRFEEAEKALCWLRGWVQPVDVQAEFRILVDCNVQQKSTSLKAIEGSRGFFQQFVHRSFYLPLGIMILVFILKELSGTTALVLFSTVLFAEIESPIEQSTATAILGAMNIIGRLVVLLSIDRLGKRKLASVCALVSACCYVSMAIVGFLELQGDFLWIPTIAMIVAALAFYSGMASIPLMLNSEIFPAHIRYIGTSVGLSIANTCDAIMSKAFLYIVGAITWTETFLVFAIFNAIGAIAYYFLLPETEGKSLKEIEDHFHKPDKHSNQVNKS